MGNLNVVYVCKNCAFASDDFHKASAHSAPNHLVFRYTNEELVL